MIINNEPLSIPEVLEYVKDKEADIVKFAEKFTNLKPKDAKEMKAKLEEFGFMKMRPEHMVKIIDLLPENEEELNKIFTGVGLNEDESNKILDTVKQFK